jgi:outer membrane murein-binding lipoprotein Lpp
MSANTAEGLESSLTNGSIEQTVESLVAVVKEQAERIHDLEQELESVREDQETAARDRAETKQRVSSLEEGPSKDTTPTPEPDNNGSTTPQTPLERIITLPEQMAETELTANQQRSRFVATDIVDYSRSVPAGRAIKSSEISTVLRAGTDCKGRSQTVSRVIEFLNRLGGDGVKVVERRGERRVVFDDETVDRLQRLSTRREGSNTVVATAGG